MGDDQSPQKVSQERDMRNEKESGIRFAILSVFLLIFILGIFYQTTFSMVSTWIRSETYTHGFLILPITIWLIWRKRKVLSYCQPESTFLALIPLSLVGVIWMLGSLVDVLVVQQLALVAILVLGFWVVMGTRLCKLFMFPLAFLFFAVPMGEGLVPAMMEYTATVTVALVKLTGIPVYRDGLFISLPSGNWSVVEACSGVRYLISSITLGCLFAYINYTSYKKRLAFILVAAIVPIIANGLRAYMIVMLGHLSGMTLAVGVDHLIYGWVFFGFVMLILFTIGSRWRDPDQDVTRDSVDSIKEIDSKKSVDYSNKHLMGSLAVTIVAISLWPAWVFALNKLQHVESYAELQLPIEQRGWQIEKEKLWSWTPRSVGSDREVHQFYSAAENGMGAIGIKVSQYLEQKQGAEVVNSQNNVFNNQMSRWRVAEKNNKKIIFNGQEIEIVSAILKGPGKKLLVWYWYRIGTYYTVNNYLAKVREVESKLIDGRGDAAIFSIATSINTGDLAEEITLASEHLHKFLNDVVPQYEAALDKVVLNEVALNKVTENSVVAGGD